MAKRRFCAHWAAAIAMLALASRAVTAGLIIENDGSDLCAQNLKECTARCAAPQNFLFMCNSGGTFNKPYSDCKCTTPPPVGAKTDGAAIFQMVQWPGPEACQSNTWLYDCAQYLNLQSTSNNMQGQATDQASAMAAVAAMQAAQQAQAAAMAAAQEQMATAGSSSQAGGMPGATAGTTPGIPGLDSGSAGAPGLGGAAPAPAGGMMMGGQDMSMMGGAGAGAQPMGGAGMMGSMGGGMGGMSAGAGLGGMSAGAGLGGMSASAGAGMPTNSLMGTSSSFGHRHLLQGGVLGAGAPTAAGPAAMPTTSLNPACTKPLQGLVTAQGGAVMVIPNFKGVATMATRGNDTMFIQLGGQGSQCIAAYKLKGGQIMDLGRPADAPAPAAAKSGASLISVASASLAMLLATMLLLL